MVDSWTYRGHDILFENSALFIDGEQIEELYGEIYTRERVKHFIENNLGDRTLDSFLDSKGEGA